MMLRARRSSCRLLILAYHRILYKPHDFTLDEGVISVSPEVFEEEVKYCKKYFSLIDFQQLKDVLESKIILPSNPLIITFDDGYRDNYTYAFPILKKYNVPATIFLTVDYIGTDRVFWWDEVSYYMKNSGYYLKEDVDRVLRLLKNMSNKERVKKIEELKNKAKIELSVDRQILNWEEIEEMCNNRIEFGSHTMTHPVLSQLKNKDGVTYEIEKSKEVLEDKLSKEIIAFSYPVGGINAFNEDIKEGVKKAGYYFAVTYTNGINYLNNGIDRYALNRLHLDQQSFARFKAKLAYPQLFKR
jgi:peptidoglycan/xylan/chitin deacetylase (PgdA/CDA1 family)